MKTEFEVTMTIEVKDVGGIAANSAVIQSSIKKVVEGISSGDVVEITTMVVSRQGKVVETDAEAARLIKPIKEALVDVRVSGSVLAVVEYGTGYTLMTTSVRRKADHCRQEVLSYISLNSLEPTSKSIANFPWLKS